ncbi:MAG: hypothetical protein R3E76_07860 [Planctomycetota bacterium]
MSSVLSGVQVNVVSNRTGTIKATSTEFERRIKAERERLERQRLEKNPKIVEGEVVDNDRARMRRRNRDSHPDERDRTTELGKLAEYVRKTHNPPSPSLMLGGGVVVGSGDVEGPNSSTDNAIARYDGTTGKVIQNSGVTLADDDHIIGPSAVTMEEQAAALPVASGQGQFWVKDNSPSAPKFTDDTGIDHDLMLGSNNLSDIADDNIALKNLISGASVIGAPALADKLGMLDVTGAGTGGYITLQGIYDLIVSLTSGTPSLSTKIAAYISGGKSITAQSIFNLVNSLTAETAPATGDKLALYDASAGQTDAVTLENVLKVVGSLTQETSVTDGYKFLVVNDAGLARYAKFEDLNPTGTNLVPSLISYIGSGSSGKTVTLTGINRAYYIRVVPTSISSANAPNTAAPAGSTGAIRRWSDPYSGSDTTWSLSAPFAGSAQVLTINNTYAEDNQSSQTYEIYVVGTSI